MILLSISAYSQYVDLGLPSGTKWKAENESGRYDIIDALNYYYDNLPSVSQFQELIDNCTWIWKGDGYKVIGKIIETFKFKEFFRFLIPFFNFNIFPYFSNCSIFNIIFEF